MSGFEGVVTVRALQAFEFEIARHAKFASKVTECEASFPLDAEIAQLGRLPPYKSSLRLCAR